MRLSLLASVAGMVCGCCAAQDRRQVTEPSFPPTCSTVAAKLVAAGGAIRSEDEGRLDSERLQAALDGCGTGRAVELVADGTKNAFLSGPISIPAGVTLRIDGGVTLFGSRDPAVYEKAPGSCGLVNNEAPGCKALISVHHASHAGVMGEGTIDGRGGAELLHGASTGRSVTWWQLAEQARAGGRQQVPRILVVDGSDDFTLYRITLKNSPNFHVTFADGRGFTVWDVKIDTPANARNTDGIDPGGSASDITVTKSSISTGDDNIAVKGSGTGVQHMSVIDNHFYRGHGMSVGSETFGGVSDLLVRNLTIDGADNGIRIKSNVHRGGLVERVTFDDVCIRNNKTPITLDTRYDNPGPETNLIPKYRNILLRHVRVSGGGKITVVGQDAEHRTEVKLDDVLVDAPASYTLFARDASVSYGPGPVNFRLQGTDVSASGDANAELFSSTAFAGCAARFVPFPR